MERKFKSHMVDVRGLSRKEAKEKRKRAYREFMLYRDLKETLYISRYLSLNKIRSKYTCTTLY